MQRFVSRRVIKIPRYKLLIIKVVSIFIIILIIYFSISIFISSNNSKLLYLINYNSFGNNLNSPYIYNKDLYLYKNSFGLIPYSKTTNYNSNNMKDLIISKPLVYLYNTFQTAQYQSTNNNDYNINPISSTATLILAEYLRKEGINSQVELTSINALVKEKNYSNNYLASKELLTKAQKINPTLNYFFDLQISSETYQNTTYETKTGNYAKIKFIIGTNYPTYELNLELATILNTKLIKQNPNLSQGISLVNTEIYNEDLNPHVLLIEIGGQDNTITEVTRTLKVLANVIKEVINEKEKN